MEDQNESLMKEMEETRTSLSEKLEALESRVVGVVENATSTANEIVENVKDTVHGVTDKVESGMESVAETFNLSRQCERHPWMAFGLATTFGCMVGFTLNRRPRRSGYDESSRPQRPFESWQVGGGLPQQQAAAAPAAPQKESWFAEELRRLKGLAVGALMGMARDMVQKALPEAVGSRLAQEFDTVTSKFGAEPIPGPVLGESEEPATEARSGRDRRKSVSGDGNRLRGTGLN